MSRTLGSPRHDALRAYIKGRREKAGFTQHELAKRLRRSQSYVATIETGQRRIDVVELLDLAHALRFDPVAAIRHLEREAGVARSGRGASSARHKRPEQT